MIKSQISEPEIVQTESLVSRNIRQSFEFKSSRVQSNNEELLMPENNVLLRIEMQPELR